MILIRDPFGEEVVRYLPDEPKVKLRDEVARLPYASGKPQDESKNLSALQAEEKRLNVEKQFSFIEEDPFENTPIDFKSASTDFEGASDVENAFADKPKAKATQPKATQTAPPTPKRILLRRGRKEDDEVMYVDGKKTNKEIEALIQEQYPGYKEITRAPMEGVQVDQYGQAFDQSDNARTYQDERSDIKYLQNVEATQNKVRADAVSQSPQKPKAKGTPKPKSPSIGEKLKSLLGKEEKIYIKKVGRSPAEMPKLSAPQQSPTRLPGFEAEQQKQAKRSFFSALTGKKETPKQKTKKKPKGRTFT